MTGFSDVHNGGAYARSARGSGDVALTAGGSGDNVAANGAWISRKHSKGIALSAKIIISYSAVLAANATLKFGGIVQDASDSSGTGSAQYDAAVPATVVATGPTGGGTVTGTFEIDVDLGGAREYIRSQITPDLSAANTDTASFNVTYVFFGQQRGPTTGSPVNLASADAI